MSVEDERSSFGALSFAESQLAKYGWEKGSGLGRHRDGISKAISVGFKNDTNGLGAKSDEWSFAWWDHVFNKTSASIQINKSDSSDIIEVSATQNQQAAKALLYGSFVKATPTTAQRTEEKDYSQKITDEELLRACEGRTARKGARAHQPGKLIRAGMAALAGDSSDDEEGQQRRGPTKGAGTAYPAGIAKENEETAKCNKRGKKEKSEKKLKRDKSKSGDKKRSKRGEKPLLEDNAKEEEEQSVERRSEARNIEQPTQPDQMLANVEKRKRKREVAMDRKELDVDSTRKFNEAMSKSDKPKDKKRRKGDSAEGGNKADGTEVDGLKGEAKSDKKKLKKPSDVDAEQVLTEHKKEKKKRKKAFESDVEEVNGLESEKRSSHRKEKKKRKKSSAGAMQDLAGSGETTEKKGKRAKEAKTTGKEGKKRKSKEAIAVPEHRRLI